MQKYNSGDDRKLQPHFRWAQSSPNTFSPDDPRKRIHCNGRPIKPRDWRTSREHHRNAAGKRARCAQHVLEQLPDSHTIIKGCIKYPKATPDEWRVFKRKFRRIRDNYCKVHNVTIAIDCKQHIVFAKDAMDDMHFDYVGWTDADLSGAKLTELIRDWIDRAGGKRKDSSVIVITDRSPDNLERICNYTYKFASDNDPEQLDKYRRSFPLPATRFPVTWTVGKFWRKETRTVETTRCWNGETIIRQTTQSPLQQVWREWLATMLPNDSPPAYTDFAYRQHRKLGRLLESHPIRGNVKISTSKTPKYGLTSMPATTYTTSQIAHLLYVEVWGELGGWQFRLTKPGNAMEARYIVKSEHGLSAEIDVYRLAEIIDAMALPLLRRTINRSSPDVVFNHWGSMEHIAEIVPDTAWDLAV